MKVTIVVGGRWHAFDLAKELLDAGVLYRLITTYPKAKTRQWGIPDEKVVSLPFSLILEKLVYKIGKRYLFMRFQSFIHNLFGQSVVKHLEGSDVIHGWSSFSLPALKWAKENNVPFLLERSSSHMRIQCKILQEEYKKIGLKWRATHPKIVAQELQEYELADKIAVPSLFVQRSFLEQHFPERKIVLNNFGTNLKDFYPGEKKDDKFRVVYAGSLSVRKGIHYLVRGFRDAKLPNSELCLVGGTLAETQKLLGKGDQRVKCVGHVPQGTLVTFYQNSSVFVMASLEEGMAMVQLQALACGLPLICTRNTGGEDLLRLSGKPIQIGNDIEEYPAGYVVPAQSSQSISVCIRLLAQSPKLLDAKQRAAVSLRSTSLSWRSYGVRAIKCYRNLT